MTSFSTSPPTSLTPRDDDQPAEFLGAAETEPEGDPVAPKKDRGDLKAGILFLLPNILGFLAFTTIPLIASLVFAFTNWDLKYHNRFKDEWPQFIGFENFITLFRSPDFLRYLGNTLFFMMGIPFGIAASLGAALLLSRDLGGTRKQRGKLFGLAFAVVGVMLGLSAAVYFAAGGGIWAMLILFAGVIAAALLGGVIGGQTVYRTLFYLPHFTSGVATFILWKKLFNPQQGPLTLALNPVLDGVSTWANATPLPLIRIVGILLFVAAAGILWFGMARLRRWFREGDLGSAATAAPFALLLIPALVTFFWLDAIPQETSVVTSLAGLFDSPERVYQRMGEYLTIFAAAVGLLTIVSFLRGQELHSRAMEGFGSAFILCAALMVAQFILIGLAVAVVGLPEAARAGIEPPKWINDPRWVKPSLMLVSFWGAVGSNTMLLYLAALTNVPGELYEAADIDGARPFDRFWNVTWPQLAPTTFFVVVMAMIGGLQGGFEMVRTMTQGGPAGLSTPLSYFIYDEGFQVGRIGYASGVAWALFVLILVVTLFNWTFGNKYVND